MKKQVLGLTAFVVAFAFVAFSAFKSANVTDSKQPPAKYLTYDGSGPQNQIGNYNPIGTAPTTPPAPCDEAEVLCWIRVHDADGNGVVNSTDFSIVFEQLDVVADTQNSLDDETEQAGILELKQ